MISTQLFIINNHRLLRDLEGIRSEQFEHALISEILAIE